MWTESQCEAVKQSILNLGHRLEVDEYLGRCYGLRSSESHNVVEYSGSNVGRWIYVRYGNDNVVSVSFVEAN